jgi:hypothetical protein
MLQIAASVFGIAFGLVVLLYALRRAPEGSEKGDGFHHR